jgi:hypothetical protein
VGPSGAYMWDHVLVGPYLGWDHVLVGPTCGTMRWWPHMWDYAFVGPTHGTQCR